MLDTLSMADREKNTANDEPKFAHALGTGLSANAAVMPDPNRFFHAFLNTKTSLMNAKRLSFEEGFNVML